MEPINYPIKGSLMTMRFLDNFSCFNCKEIGNLPHFLKCNHIYCENCVSNFNMKQTDGNLVCPFCYDVTKKEDFLPEVELRLLLIDLKSIDDEQFIKKYKNKLDFNNNSECEFRNVVLFLLKFFSIENKCINNENNNCINTNGKKKCHKRNYLELKNDKVIIDNYNFNCNGFRNKPIFKSN